MQKTWRPVSISAGWHQKWHLPCKNFTPKPIISRGNQLTQVYLETWPLNDVFVLILFNKQSYCISVTYFKTTISLLPSAKWQLKGTQTCQHENILQSSQPIINFHWLAGAHCYKQSPVQFITVCRSQNNAVEQNNHFPNEKSAHRWRKHCTLAVVIRSQKFSPAAHPLPGGKGRPKFNQLEMVITFTYKPSLVRIDARNFELSW